MRDPISKPLSIRFQTEIDFVFVPAVRVGFDVAIGIQPLFNGASQQ